ncbi:S-Ena type endospore appendage [Gracilibacillus sp. S3-1-1]|uniref:S-Ena type endospore appendage n=1 Tax=Gracilibacillus pellucidus TaxID=3095368 RepID=A0ACC6M7N7_9BACI|nr:S-Ena type endospore appendage [Gracilibacillus sp. S3-1-1]MDX8046782.1 S-Ena type endospore appendage [Gracilibacillus sp. S3-1-1]
MSEYCIRAPIVYDWVMKEEEMQKCKLIPFKNQVKHIEDCICINFRVNCQSELPTIIWQAVGDKMDAVTFSIEHEGTCSCDWSIMLDNEELTTLSPNNSLETTVEDIEQLSVACVNNCSDDENCRGKLYIVIHYLLCPEEKQDIRKKKVECFISDKHGHPIETLHCKEFGTREAKWFLSAEGQEMYLQKVHLLIKGYYTIKIIDVCDGSFVICTFPIMMRKTLILCAPEGTNITCKIHHLECNACIMDKQQLKNCWEVCMNLAFCIDVQSVFKAVIGIDAKNCMPRENILLNHCK